KTTTGLTTANKDAILDSGTGSLTLDKTSNLGTGNLTLISGDGVNQNATGGITAAGLGLQGSGTFDLKTNATNNVQTFAAEVTGNVSMKNGGTLTIDTVTSTVGTDSKTTTGIDASGSVFAQTLTGDLVLNQPVQSQAIGKAITLVAEDNFINNVGKGALSAPNGNWLVYATSPAGNVNGHSVLGGSQQFNSPFPTPAGFGGNGFLYKVGAPPVPPVFPFITEPVTFDIGSLIFNDLQWRDLSGMGETVLFPAGGLLCVNLPINQTEESSPLTDPLMGSGHNLSGFANQNRPAQGLPYVAYQWNPETCSAVRRWQREGSSHRVAKP
ncbi:MAG: hypothetical protein Q6I77_08585, partial [Gloeomargarita sp. DG_1_4_bins_134]